MHLKTPSLILLTAIFLVSGALVAPQSAEAGFFSWIKSFFVNEEQVDNQEASVHESVPDASQDPEKQIELLTEEQRQKQRQAQAEVENLKQELAEVQAQIEAVEDDDGNTAPPAPSIQDTSLDSLKELETKLLSRIEEVEDLARKLAKANFRAISLTGKIDNLSGVTLNDAEITGTLTGLTDAHIPNDITVSNYVPTSGGTLTGSITGTDATFSGTLTVSASTTFNGVEYLFPSSDGTNTQVLTTDGAGGLSWTTISSATSNWEAFNNSGIRLATTSHQVLIGGSSTSSTAALEVSGQSYFSDNVGLGDTTPSYTLTVSGDSQVSGLVDADHFVATSTTATSTFAWGIQTTALDVTSTSATSTFANGISFAGGGLEFADGTKQYTSPTPIVLQKSSDYTITANDVNAPRSVVMVDASGANIDITLPTVGDLENLIARINVSTDPGSNNIEVYQSDGTTELWTGVDKGDFVEVTSDGTNYQVIDHYESYYARVYVNANESVAAGASEQVVNISENIDIGGIWNTTNDEVDIPFDAWIDLHWHVMGVGSRNIIQAEAKLDTVYIRNGAAVGTGPAEQEFSQMSTLSGRFKSTSGQKLELWARSNSSDTTLTIGGDAAGDESLATIKLTRIY